MRCFLFFLVVLLARVDSDKRSSMLASLVPKQVFDEQFDPHEATYCCHEDPNAYY